MFVPLLMSSAIPVAPHAGAWIEIINAALISTMSHVAPHAGAWIEIKKASLNLAKPLVAPHAGAWIEIEARLCCYLTHQCRSPRGSVD